MDDSGFVLGLAVGITIGIILGRRQKPFSEMSDSEKRLRIGLVAVLSISAVAGIVVAFLYSS
jgi:hypothetical protein